MKIFLLEDDYSLHETIKETLELESYTVNGYYDGISAFNNISPFYDIYLLDINTPNLEGIELIKFIREINRKAIIIMISASTDIITIKKAYRFGCDDFLKKPFDIEELILKIERVFVNDLNNILPLSVNTIYYLSKDELYINNEVCILTKNEKNLLRLLINNRNHIVTHEQIEDYVYDRITKSSEAIRSMIKRLRKKIPKDIIHTATDEGYILKI